jgi:hypothetical protein
MNKAKKQRGLRIAVVVFMVLAFKPLPAVLTIPITLAPVRKTIVDRNV